MSTSVSHSRIRTTKFALLTLLAISTFTVAGLRTAAGQESAPACSPVSNIVSPQDVPSGCGCAPPSGGSSIGTGHGSLVKGTVEVTSTISNGWWNTTWRFTSTDLLNIYGYSTLSSAGSFRVGSPWTGARSSVTQKFSATIFVLSQDETPLPTGTETPLSAGTSNAIPVTNITKTSNTMSSTVLANSGNNAASNISFQSTSYNGHIYPQTTYRAVTQPPCAGGGTTYVVEDPINFAYEEDHPLGDIVTHLTASAGWQSASCVSDSYIYDFSASPPGYTVENQQLTKPGGETLHVSRAEGTMLGSGPWLTVELLSAPIMSISTQDAFVTTWTAMTLLKTSLPLTSQASILYSQTIFGWETQETTIVSFSASILMVTHHPCPM